MLSDPPRRITALPDLRHSAAGVGADIGAAFVDHADHADRRGDALDAQPVRPRPVGQHAIQRIGQRGHVLQSLGHRFDPRLGQCQPVAEGGGPGGRRQGRRRWRPGWPAPACAMRRPWRAARRCVAPALLRASSMRRGASGVRGALQMLGGVGLDMHRVVPSPYSLPRSGEGFQGPAPVSRGGLLHGGPTPRPVPLMPSANRHRWWRHIR